MIAFVFPGQGSQFVGMADTLNAEPRASQLFEEANAILGFDIQKIMTDGSEEELRRTDVTQPAVFLHSMISISLQDNLSIDAVAGHSLGEISALAGAGVLTFESGLRLVAERAQAMQQACEESPGTMAAIVGLDDEKVEEVCAEVKGVVVAANYNCPGQLVISGDVAAVERACEILLERGAKRALPLQVGGAFHSPLMQLAEDRLAKAITATDFFAPQCPVYQNVDGQAHTDIASIKANLLRQLTSPVKWTQTIQQMIADGFQKFVEVGGNGKVLRGMIRRISREVVCEPL